MKTEILGIPVDTYTNNEVLEKVFSYLMEKKKKNHLIITPNPELIMEAQKDKEFRYILETADLVVPDGIGVVLASKLNKIKIKERVAGCDLIFSILDKIKFTGNTVYILGAGPRVAEKAKKNMEEKFPGVNISGVHDGFFDKEEEKRIIEEIKSLKPDILLVGLGFPKQEKWIYNNKDLPVHFSIACGGSIDVMAGTVKRAPVIFQKLGLEWLYRLMKQPGRFIRMLILPKFAIIVVLDKIKKMFTI